MAEQEPGQPKTLAELERAQPVDTSHSSRVPAEAAAQTGRSMAPTRAALRAAAQPTSPAAGPAAWASDPAAESDRQQLEELRFLHEVARLATTARTWDELLSMVVDRTRDALQADVSSLYLLDRDGHALTLATTNGLDRFQIGRAKVPFGQGITGRVAATREPMVIPDVRSDDRFLWVRGMDQRRFVASMLSVPLSWNDEVVGVLNVQTEQPRDFTPHDVAQLRAIADLLAGIVEKGRLQREAEAQVAALRALEHAQAELVALVTHELRTPLAVVRAYLDLLGEAVADGSATTPNAIEWHRLAQEQVTRLDRLVDSILASVRPDEHGPIDLMPIDLTAIVDETLAAMGPLLRRHRVVHEGRRGLRVLGEEARLRQILEHLLENAVKYAPPGTTITVTVDLQEGVARLGVADEGPGVPEEWRERIFEPYARRSETAAARGSGIGLYAARRLGESMGARLWCEPTPAGGARFVVALASAVAL
jgi:signal transduction histidine kinase